jgi:hypothetical protein
MFITVRVIPKVAKALHHRKPCPEMEELANSMHELGLSLIPIHPGVEDEDLMRYFAVEVPDRSSADGVVQRLRQCAAVDAAYIKPPDELP